MLRCARLIAAALLCGGLSGCGTPASSPAAELSDIQRTFARATVVLPSFGAGAPLRTTMDSPAMAARLQRIPGGSRMPVVVYLHGCTGLANFAFLEQLAEAGFVVVAPDSFARRFRPLQCDPQTRTGGRNLFVYDFRLEEIAFVMDELHVRRWVDWGRMFLVGASEGGVATALYRGDEFKARVIAQWTCGGSPHVAGIAAPRNEPILAVRSAQDPWYAAPGATGDCGVAMGDRPGSRSLVLELAAGHDVLAEPSVVLTIVEFLRLHASR